MMTDYFPNLIGQHNVKKKLGFYLDAFRKTGQAPFLNLIGAKGLGKTEFAKAFAKNLYNEDGDRRSFLELNCSTIKNNEAFFEQIFLPLIAVNCAILGTSLFMEQRQYTFIESVVFGFSSGIGWFLAIVAFSAVLQKLKYADLPKGLDGFAINMIITGLIAMAFMSFAGIKLT